MVCQKNNLLILLFLRAFFSHLSLYVYISLCVYILGVLVNLQLNVLKLLCNITNKLYLQNTSSLSGVIRLMSWNVKGLNSRLKRNKILNHLKCLNTKIAFLQETHLKPADSNRMGWSAVSFIFYQ